MRNRRPGRRAGFGARFLGAVAGLILSSTTALGQPSVTFSKDVAPILYEHCVACHRPGEIGPFSLLTYADARPQARALARAVRARTMPPWKPEPGYGEFLGARRLTEQQIATIERWADEGALEGDPSALPPAPTLPDGWRLGPPDLVVTLGQPYSLAPGGSDLLRNFVIPIPTTSTRYVRGIEFRPGNARVVHHANLRVDSTSGSRMLDDADLSPGFDGRI